MISDSFFELGMSMAMSGNLAEISLIVAPALPTSCEWKRRGTITSTDYMKREVHIRGQRKGLETTKEEEKKKNIDKT